jgi:RNA polymerase sigma factor (sigma-70 family)
MDKGIWLRIGNNDQEAFSEVFRFYYKRFYNYGKKFTCDVSLIDDAVQDTLLEIWDKRKKLISIEYPSTYFYASFRYGLFKKIKLQKQIVPDNQILVEPDFSIDHFIIGKEAGAELKLQLLNALATLTARQREAIFLRFYEGLSYDQVAIVMDITTKAVYKIMSRALIQLKENMVITSLLLYIIFHTALMD